MNQPPDGSKEESDILSQRAMSQLMKEMHRALIGDPLNPQRDPGVLKMHADMHMDYYGTNGQNGTKQKVDTLWDGRTKLLFAGMLLSGIVALVAWLVPLLLKSGAH